MAEEKKEENKEEKKKEEEKEAEAEGKNSAKEESEEKGEEREEAVKNTTTDEAVNPPETAAVAALARTAVDGEEKEEKKRRIGEAAPARAIRASEHHALSNFVLQSAPTMTPEPIPSQLFPPPQVQKVDIELQLVSDLQVAIVTPTT